MTLMSPSPNQFPQGALATVLPTMPTPTLPPTGPEPPTLKLGQWIMGPSKYVLILTNTLGLVLYFYYPHVVRRKQSRWSPIISRRAEATARMEGLRRSR